MFKTFFQKLYHLKDNMEKYIVGAAQAANDHTG
jgi:hypothetical protein